MPPRPETSTLPRWQPALTLRSVLASLLAVFALAVVVQISTVVVGMEQSAEFGLPLPGIGIFLVLLGSVFAAAAFARWQLLSRPELLCVFYVMVLAAPLLTQGFWHRVVSVTATLPRSADFKKMDYFSDRLWPHGANLLGEEFAVRLEGTGSEQIVSKTLRLPIGGEGKEGVRAGEPYLLSFAAKADGLGSNAFYFVRARVPGEDSYQEILRSRDPGGVTALQPEGFERVGAYGFDFSGLGEATEIELEFGLSGIGTVQMRDAQLFDVSALETLYTGRVSLPAAEYDRLPASEREGVLRRPESFWSAEGLAYFLRAGIPVRDWVVPLGTWGALIALMLGGVLASNAIMRRQWMDSERLPLPLARIPAALIGEPDEQGIIPRLWGMRVLWAGAAVGLAWGLLRGFHFYNPNLPDLSLKVELGPYFGPAWGGFWSGVSFEVVAVVVAVAVFVELNVLLSLVVGFLLFRALFFLGFATGWSALPNYPFPQHQQSGSFLIYGLLLLFLARKYLWGTLREALRPGSVKGLRGEGEIFSYRTAYVLLLAVVLGSFFWAKWVGVSPGGMLLYIGYMLIIALVSSKFRAEAGVPYGYFSPPTAALILFMIGGIPLFGPDLVLLSFVASFIFSVSVFFLLPGAQLEMMELGKRYSVKPSHITGVIVLGLLGGFIIGGWVFLSGGYAFGGESLRYAWAFDTKVWYFGEFTAALNAAADGREEAGGIVPSTLAVFYGGGVAAILAVLRQMFAGFWLHPIGFILGPSYLLQMTWGSILVAWVLRSLFVRLGGSMAVRLKLQPFFIGVFLGSVVSWGIWFVYATSLRAQGVEAIYGAMP